ncbi:MAG: hypothetical protein ACC645_17890, partial [Pirellulales bacterium]
MHLQIASFNITGAVGMGWKITLLTSAAVVVLGLCGDRAQAQDSLLAEIYGQGVHYFFAGEYEMAHEALTSCIEQGSRDPRCFYFRGLAYTRLGRPDEAKADYEQGAKLEIEALDRIYPISVSLQRVQGKSRVALEKYRQGARIAARIKSRKAEKARYDRVQRAEKEVVRDLNRKPPTTPETLVGEAPPPDESDPFANEETTAMGKSPEKAAPAAKPVDDAPPATVPSEPTAPKPTEGTDPFGAPPSTPPAAPAGSDPFGAPAAPMAPAAEDPFGGVPAKPPAPAAQPADGAPAPAE